MNASEQTPNTLVRDLYDRLGDLLQRGDDAYIEEGPALVQDALADPGFLDGIETETAVDKYTRAKVIGDPGKHVIRYMEWPPEYALMPHEHHGRPCFEVLIDGTLVLTEMHPETAGDGRYEMEVGDVTVCRAGEAAVVDPRDGDDVHAVYSPERSRSLHCYPSDEFHSYGYVPADENDENDAPTDYYRRERFELDAD